MTPRGLLPAGRSKSTPPLRIVEVEHDRAVLRSETGAWAPAGWIVNLPEHLQEAAIRNALGVVIDHHDLGVTCPTGRDLLVVWPDHMPSAVADGGAPDPGEAAEGRLGCPE